MNLFQTTETSKDKPFNATQFASGLLVGALATYFFDPQKGARRRHLLRDQVFSKALHFKKQALRATQDFENRLQGWVAESASLLKTQQPIDDEKLHQRVRAEFGRKVRHAKSVHTTVSEGVVTLSGPILVDEVQRVLSCVRQVHGVRDVINLLDVHESSEHISGLQGRGAKYFQ